MPLDCRYNQWKNSSSVTPRVSREINGKGLNIHQLLLQIKDHSSLKFSIWLPKRDFFFVRIMLPWTLRIFCYANILVVVNEIICNKANCAWLGNSLHYINVFPGSAGVFSYFLLASKRRSIECVKRKEERENKKSMLQYFASLFLQQHRTKQFITFVFLLQCSTVTPLCCAVFFSIPGNGENCSCAFLKKAFEAINCLVSFVDVYIIYSHLQ